jgi:hypothetical protein
MLIYQYLIVLILKWLLLPSATTTDSERPCLPDPPDLDLSEESQQLAAYSD